MGFKKNRQQIILEPRVAVVSFHITFALELRAHQQMRRATRQKTRTRGCPTVSTRGPLSLQSCPHPSDTHTPCADCQEAACWRLPASLTRPVHIRTVLKVSLSHRATPLSLKLWSNSQAHFKEAGKTKWKPRSWKDDLGCTVLAPWTEAWSQAHISGSSVAAWVWNLSTGEDPWDPWPARPAKTSECIILSETLFQK